MERKDWRYGQGTDGPKMSRADMSSIPRDLRVERFPQTIETLEEIEGHPTISQDWTNQATVDSNRLVALQEKKFVAQGNKRGGGEAGLQDQLFVPTAQSTEKGRGALATASFDFPPVEYPKQSSIPLHGTPVQVMPGDFQRPGIPDGFQGPGTPLLLPDTILTDDSQYEDYSVAAVGRAAKYISAHNSRHDDHSESRSPHGRGHGHRRTTSNGKSTQDQDLYPDYSSFEEEEDHTESSKSEGHCSEVSDGLPHSSYMAGLRKAGRRERRRPCVQQPYGQDKTTSWSLPFNETNKTDYELKKANGLDGKDRYTGRRVEDQSSRQYSCNHSYPAPISRRQSPQNSNKAEGLENNVPVQQLRSDLEKLKRENVQLKSRLRERLPRLQVVYRVSRLRSRSGGCDYSDGDDTVTDMYLDKPQLMEGDQGMVSLQGHLPIFRLDSYLERYPNVSVIVFQDTWDSGAITEAEDGLSKVQWSESIFVTSPKLMKTLKLLKRRLSLSLGYRISLDLTGSTATFPAPYLPFYHYLGKLREYAADLPPKTIQEWNLLVKYIEHSYGDQYGEVDKMLAAGTIIQEFIPYLIKDGDTIVRRDSRGHSAYVATSQPIAHVKRQNNGLAQNPGGAHGRQMDFKFSLHFDNSDGTVEGMSDVSMQTLEWEIETESWLFDGNFEKNSETIILKISSRRDKTLSIKDLEVYPIQYANPDLVLSMKNAGLELWKSRSRRYVSYHPGRAETDTKSSKPRYMIDPATYKKLHAKAVSANPLQDDLGPERMSAEEPPADPFLLLLPRTINGFNMQNKKWEELEVARISEVSWNKEAFESLVVEPTTKALIKALVMQQLEKEKGTDLIAGKGQGLIVLLHGGPGTGKTFTAETVAEIAEKPLYRVTCGDLGTEPTEVEKYLESVLYLGKIWDCVVLLDEADVYLEERSMESLPRNALVSVFLRVLEYYEGILILTSNRVGTFDESFKSRIQLALHYEKLKLNDRRTIWENFIRRLQKVEEVGIDFDDINKHMDDLARNELNGRQIRNAITTARQFARHREKDLDYADLQQVIKIALKFDKHTMEMQGGMNDDARKREEGIRP
ncbi:hypothetical protein BDR22DRAFT_103168 [Usnea florida]